MYQTFDPLILASSSPRRRELLEMAGIPFDIIIEPVDETPRAGESPSQLVARLSEAKARIVADRLPDRWVLGADTVVVVDGEVFGKPLDDEDAVRMLRILQGREHTVTSGFSLVREDIKHQIMKVCHTIVRMAPAVESRIRRYVSTGEPRDKAGAYAIQGAGLQFVAEIRGSYTNVVGLPLDEVVAAWEKVGGGFIE
jgi:septum formation protein